MISGNLCNGLGSGIGIIGIMGLHFFNNNFNFKYNISSYRDLEPETFYYKNFMH